MTTMMFDWVVSGGLRSPGRASLPGAPDLRTVVSQPGEGGGVGAYKNRNRPQASTHESRAGVVDPRMRRSIQGRMVPALCLLAVLSACAGSRTPSSYTGSVRTAFIAGCQETGQTGGVCTCVFRQLRLKVPFGDFERLNRQLADRPGRLPPNLTQLIEPCNAQKR